jgi:uncharacterized protein (DUF1015 family)
VSDLRPFAARVVRPEWAHRTVVALTELPEGTAAAPAAAIVDPAAYEEAPPALYAYRQERDGVSHSGVVCEVSMRAFVYGRVRGHEAVQERRVEALVRHHATTVAPPALVALLHLPGEAFARVMTSLDTGTPILDFTGPEGRRQTVWRLSADGATSELVSELANAQLYVADGHHRVAAALSEWRGGGGSDEAGLLCIVHATDGLRLSAFHRRVPGPVPRDEILRALSRGFEVLPCAAEPSPSPGSFGLYVAGSWFQVRAEPTSTEAARRLDVEVLHERVLGPLARGTEIASAETSVADLIRRCDEDDGALFTLAPPPLTELTRLADAGEVMPPKTTYFAPKPCAGVFLRPTATVPVSTGDVIR